MRLLGQKKTPGRVRQRLDSQLEAPAQTLTYRGARQPAADEKSSKTTESWLKRSGLLVLLLAAVAGLINVLTLSPNVKVLPLANQQQTNLLQATSIYQKAANKLLKGSLRDSNKLTVDTGQLARQLKVQFPELAGVTTTIPFFAHQPVIYIEPAQPVLVLAGNNGSFLIDTKGRALLMAVSPSDLHQPSLPTVNDQSGLKLYLNRQALPVTDVDFIQTVSTQLMARHVSISSMTLPPAASELDVQIAGQPYIAKFNLENSDARQQAGTLLATIAYLQKQNIKPAKYIDVRVDGRAYYQ